MGNNSVGQHSNPWVLVVNENILEVKRKRNGREDREPSQLGRTTDVLIPLILIVNAIPKAPRNTSRVTLVVDGEGGMVRNSEKRCGKGTGRETRELQTDQDRREPV